MEYLLVYHSYASSEIKGNELHELQKRAKSYNSSHKITGCLLFHNNEFLHLLEGPEEELNQLYAHIQKDDRHHDVTLVLRKEIGQRMFDCSNMAVDNVSEKELEIAGAPPFSSLGYVKNDPRIAENLFSYFSTSAKKPNDAMHNATVGPTL